MTECNVFYDSKLAFDTNLSNRYIDKNGYMHVKNCNITKETVNPYLGSEIPNWEELGLIPDKIYYGYRKGSELEKAVSSFNGMPLERDHLTDSALLPRIENRCGALGTDARWEEPYIKCSLVIYNQEDIDNVLEDVKKELSSAYRYTPIFESGEFEGQRYDFIMTNIIANHVALVRNGRAGSDVVVADSNINIINNKQKAEMAENKLVKDEEVMLKAGEKEIPLNALAEGEFKEDEHQKDIIDSPAKDEDVETIETTETVEDKEVDKRKDIDEVGGFLKSKGLSDEDIRYVMKLMEQASYNESEADANDSCVKDEDIEAEDKKDDKPAMDSIEAIKNETINHFKEIANATKSVKTLIGDVDMFAFDSANDIYKLAIKQSGLDPENYDESAYKGIVDVLNMRKIETVNIFALDNKTVGEEPDYLKKAKNFKRG